MSRRLRSIATYCSIVFYSNRDDPIGFDLAYAWQMIIIHVLISDIQKLPHAHVNIHEHSKMVQIY